MSSSPRDPELAALAAGAGTDHPRKLKSALTRLARPLSAADRISFFEDACRAFVAAAVSETAAELATWSFTQARKAEKDDASARDLERLHTTLLEFVPAGVVGPAVLRDHAKTLSGLLPPDEAHARFREVVCAGFDAGLIPYARLFPDLRKLAVATGIAKHDEEEFLAARLLRDGLLPGASQTIWAAARKALAAVAGRDGDLMELLIAAEPDRARHEAEGGAELAEKMRQMWLATLADAGAGARLPADWFATTGRRCAVDVLLTLVDQAGERLFRDGAEPGGDIDPDGDPAAIPPRRARWSDAPDAELRTRLKADVEAGYLYRLNRALSWLVDEGYRFRERNPGFAREMEFCDPVEALLTELRAGIPEEFAIPVSFTDNVARSVVQHREYLSVRTRREVEVDDGGGSPWRVHLGRFPKEMMPWYDGETMRVSRVGPGGRWQTFRAEGPVAAGPESEELALTYEPGARTARPEAPGAGEVTYPGASAPSRVRLHQGRISVTAPDGSQSARLGYSPRDPSVPPPAVWGRRNPVDPAGSVALRTLDRDTAVRIVTAALPASRWVLRPVRDELLRLVPEITESSLIAAVTQRMHSTAQCLLNEHWLRMKDGAAPRPPCSPLLEFHPELPVMGVRDLVSLRVFEKHALAAAEGPNPAEPELLYKVEQPHGADRLVEDFGGLARHVTPVLWPWQRPHAVWSLDELSTWANSGWGDGSGRYRLLWFEQPSPGPPSTPNIQVWRTHNGSLLSFSGWHRRGFAAVEYSPDGRFVPIRLPERDLVGDPVPQGWLSQERLLRLKRLLTENGPPPVRAETVRELAARTGLTTAQAVDLLYGDADGNLRPRALPSGADPGLPAEIADLLEATRNERPDRNHQFAFRRDSGRLGLIRERLMPDDPADLWNSGFDVARAADWWRLECERQGW
ncbi:hypothetical protein ACQPZP_20620 [Spirillospora sp. CA-142024]|uniref:hypothetical protein n=1 Tax=Spirillospora sp. CA-142024 TaxID=3240036 RepID=UPI003D8D6833